MSHTYTITCCTSELDIYSKRQSRCPECGRVFVTRDNAESGYRVDKTGRDAAHESSREGTTPTGSATSRAAERTS